MIILVDMDNTLADFDGALLDIWRKLYPNEFYVPLNERKNFHSHKDYPEHLQSKIQEICHSQNFIYNLPPIPGGIEAVKEMLAEGHDIRFCTSYLFDYNYCVFEKYQWIEKYFGKEAIERIILTRDKTLIYGDFLIDDKQEITGVKKPSWEHVLFDRPHNKDVVGKRRLNWQNWKTVIFDGK